MSILQKRFFYSFIFGFFSFCDFYLLRESCWACRFPFLFFSFSFFLLLIFFHFFIFFYFSHFSIFLKKKILKEGRTPLYIAAQNGNEQIVQFLLEKGEANVNLPEEVLFFSSFSLLFLI